jgi:tRNA pseudouridine55 synthase
LYELARKGIEIKRQPRKVRIYELRLVDSPHPLVLNTPPSPRGRGIETNNLTQQPYQLLNLNLITFSVLCSKGTYIRQLAMDIGDELGCGAHLSKLTRTYAHPFHISQAIDIDTIVTLAKAGILASIVIDPEEILGEMNKVAA